MKIGPTYYSGQIFGASISAPIFSDAMNGALAGTSVQGFTAPTGFSNSNNNGGGNGGGNGNGPGGPGLIGNLFGGLGGNNGGNGNGGNH
jgi:hypothetical protein